jgi:hypothetical protein
MEFLFIDERGPQESFRVSEPYNKVNKIAYGKDDMHLYVANVVKIKEVDLARVNEKYLKIEENYYSTRKKLDNSKELKGQKILERKRFKYGIASMATNDVEFYKSVFNLMIKYGIENCLFSISKMALVVDSRLSEWIWNVTERNKYSPTLLKYVLTKYAEIECSEDVIKKLLDKNVGLDAVLYAIQQDLFNIISENNDNKRMHLQTNSYSELLELINNTKLTDIVEPEWDASFNWEKFSFPLDLWLLEMYFSETHPNLSVVLDEGIPVSPFERFDFHEIKENEKSEEHVGLRIADVIVAITGKYMSKLSVANKHNLDNPTQRVQLSSDWFDFNESQFELVKLLSTIIFKEDRKYCYGVDTFFDTSLLFETFIRYISSYDYYTEYKSLTTSEHSDYHFSVLAEKMGEKWNDSIRYEAMTMGIYGSLKEAIEQGQYHPL